MKLSLYPYQLQFKYPFKIAHGVRTHTDIVFAKLEHEGLVSWGEASLPPYLTETQKSVVDFLEGFQKHIASDSIDSWFEKLNADKSPNMAAKAALDMALWDLKAQTKHVTVGALLGIEPTDFPLGAYTIGVSDFAEMKRKFEEATNCGFSLFKLKLDGKSDEEAVRNFRNLSRLKFTVDVNQGWQNSNEALRKIDWLIKQDCFIIEQPLSKTQDAEMPALKQKFPGLLFADESCQTIDDLERLRNCFDGVNIKLMKCGGITGAVKMIYKAKELGFKIIIGCMSESSVGCTAATQLTPFADYADLDGNYLTSNDPFSGMKVEHGKIALYPLQPINPRFT